MLCTTSEELRPVTILFPCVCVEGSLTASSGAGISKVSNIIERYVVGFSRHNCNQGSVSPLC